MAQKENMERIELVRLQFKTSLTRAFKGVEPFSGVHINIALSVSKEGLPARFLAGVIPGFALAQAIQEQFGVETSVRFFAPINIAIICNGLDEEEQFRDVGKRTISQGNELVQKLQQTHFPLVPWRLTLDQPWNKDAEELLASIWNRSLELDEEQLNQARASILQQGKLKTHLYMPHHLFGWQDCFSQFIFPEEDKPNEEELVINCMSQSERHFQTFRRRLAWDLKVTRPDLVVSRSPIDVITERCPGPHYIRSRDGERIEPSLEDLLAHGFVDIVRNLAYLINENPRFETARNDMLSIFEFFHQRWIENSKLPTFDEFVRGVSI